MEIRQIPLVPCCGRSRAGQAWAAYDEQLAWVAGSLGELMANVVSKPGQIRFGIRNGEAHAHVHQFEDRDVLSICVGMCKGLK